MQVETTILEIKSISKYIVYEKNKFIDKYESPDESTVIAAPASDFSFVETLWTGSFGHTVLARHDPTGRIKTIKILGVQTASDGRRRAETEKNVMAAVGAFPFVARLECLSRDDAGRVYLVMPLVSIGNLFELVADRGRLNETEARFFAAQMVLAIEFLHASGLAHRNVKPENALVNINGYLRLANFGASKLVGRGRTYTLCGTPDYMAPELVTFKGYGLTVDFWSLGVVLYEMVAGRLPFAGPDVGALFENIARGRYNASASFSPPLRSLVRGLIQTDLSKRIGNLKNGIADIKNHSWFRPINWLQIINQKIEAPCKLNLKFELENKDKTSFWKNKNENDFDFFN